MRRSSTSLQSPFSNAAVHAHPGPATPIAILSPAVLHSSADIGAGAAQGYCNDGAGSPYRPLEPLRQHHVHTCGFPRGILRCVCKVGRRGIRMFLVLFHGCLVHGAILLVDQYYRDATEWTLGISRKVSMREERGDLTTDTGGLDCLVAIRRGVLCCVDLSSTSIATPHSLHYNRWHDYRSPLTSLTSLIIRTLPYLI